MSAITINGDLVHYEVLGRGRPVILLHGWIGAWRYWVPLMQQLHLRYRVYALDLLGFGDSSKHPERYGVVDQALMLSIFMQQLAIPKAALIGHGLGALVAVRLASQQPHTVARMVMISLPLFDTGDLDRPAESVGQPSARPPSRLQQALADQSAQTLLTRCFKPDAPEYNKLQLDVLKTDDLALERTMQGFDARAMLAQLRAVQALTLLVHGDEDPLLPSPPESVWDDLQRGREEQLAAMVLAGVRHFPMLESQTFPRLVLDFLEAQDLSKLEIRERWTRRSR